MEANFLAYELIAVNAALAAGKRIMDIYNQPTDKWQVEEKADHSPLTLADRSANDIIVKSLQNCGIPILSEENKLLPYTERKDWKQLWIVDPLDGTKEFIKRNGEFTVNIALVENHAPIFGVVFVPASGLLYVGIKGKGAWKQETKTGHVFQTWHDFLSHARELPQTQERKNYVVVVSRSHLSAETETYVNALRQQHPQLDLLPSGSSLKICLVAEGAADVYPRFAPTCEWDTAAGHGVVAACGGEIVDAQKHSPLAYNKENILNPSFIVCNASGEPNRHN